MRVHLTTDYALANAHRVDSLHDDTTPAELTEARLLLLRPMFDAIRGRGERILYLPDLIELARREPTLRASWLLYKLAFRRALLEKRAGLGPLGRPRRARILSVDPGDRHGDHAA